MDSAGGPRIVLASRSPRRLELLSLLVEASQIEVLPPATAAEADFDSLRDWASIERRLSDVAQAKAMDVRQQLGAQQRADRIEAVLAADTVIVVADTDEALRVLGQPPEERWQETVREWFERYYVGKSHTAATAVWGISRLGNLAGRVVTSRVTFHDEIESMIDWYLGTGEPQGKAGGYALQGAGSVFVEQVVGSLSNVVGLPLEAVRELFEELGIDAG